MSKLFISILVLALSLTITSQIYAAVGSVLKALAKGGADLFVSGMKHINDAAKSSAKADIEIILNHYKNPKIEVEISRILGRVNDSKLKAILAKELDLLTDQDLALLVNGMNRSFENKFILKYYGYVKGGLNCSACTVQNERGLDIDKIDAPYSKEVASIIDPIKRKSVKDLRRIIRKKFSGSVEDISLVAIGKDQGYLIDLYAALTMITSRVKRKDSHLAVSIKNYYAPNGGKMVLGDDEVWRILTTKYDLESQKAAMELFVKKAIRENPAKPKQGTQADIVIMEEDPKHKEYAAEIGKMDLLLGSSINPKLEVQFPTSDIYSYKRETNDLVTVEWQYIAVEAITKQCGKTAARAQLEDVISRLEKIEKLSGNDLSSWLFREAIVEVLDKIVVPDFGIVEISFSNPLSSDDPVAIEMSLKSVCGYTSSYNINKQTLEIKGAHIK